MKILLYMILLSILKGLDLNGSDDKKIKKKLTLSRSSRNKNCLDKRRIWNMKMTWKYGQSGLDNSRLSYLIT